MRNEPHQQRETCEDVLEQGADVDSMAPPFLADAQIIEKAFHGREDETNTCIACNQACLDHTFKMMPCRCLREPSRATRRLCS